MNFATEAEKPRSEKITLVTIESELLVKSFSDEGGGVYSRSAEHFVSYVVVDGARLTQSSSLGAIAINEYYFDLEEKKVYIKDASLLSKDISLGFKHFFASAPLILPYDLSSGADVEWDGRVSAIGSVGQSLDEQNTGIVTESKSNVTLINTDGYFDSIFDRYIWQNKQVEFYWWFPNTEVTESVKVFDGLIDNKSFDDEKITFNISDFVYRFKANLNLPLFSQTDATGEGKVPTPIIGLPKRRVYGRVDKLRCYPVDSGDEGITAPFVGSVTSGATSIVFDDIIAEDYLGPGDEIEMMLLGETYRFKISAMTSPDVAEIEEPSEVTIVESAVEIFKELDTSLVQRRFVATGEKCHEVLSTITSIVSANRFALSSTEDLYAGDVVLCNDTQTTIRRVSGNQIVLDGVISPPPTIGSTVYRPALQGVYVSGTKMVVTRDYSFDNDNTGMKIIFNELAEFNVTKEETAGFFLDFVNGSSIVSVKNAAHDHIEASTYLRTGDWIRKDTITSPDNTWYKIKKINGTQVTINANYAGPTANNVDAKVKKVSYINSDSVVTADVYGSFIGDRWAKTAPLAIKHICQSDAGIASFNESSFSEAEDDCEFTLSIAFPESYMGKSIKARDAINLINQSVFGSLYGNSASSVSYSVLNATRRPPYKSLADDDILGFSTSSETEIYSDIKLSYAPKTDYAGEEYFSIIEESSEFVDSHIGIDQTLETTCYLYSEEDARTMAQRWLLFKSMTNTSVSIQGKMNLFLSSLNDRVLMSFDRMFKRFGAYGGGKFGIVSSVKRALTEVEIIVQDMGNIFNRVGCVAEDSANDFSAASDSEKIVSGYVVDNNTETPDASSEDGLGSNIIG